MIFCSKVKDVQYINMLFSFTIFDYSFIDAANYMPILIYLKKEEKKKNAWHIF